MAQPLNNPNRPKSTKSSNSSSNLQLPGLDKVAPKTEKTNVEQSVSKNNVPASPIRKATGSSAAVVDFITHSVAQTQKAGEHLGGLLRVGDVILLEGELGAGKTTLTKGIARGLGVGGYVNSPTFTLVNEYRSGRLPVYHLDAYRLESAAEALDFGIEEYLYGDGITLVEWPQRIETVLPIEHLLIKLNYLNETKRSLRLEPTGIRYVQLVADFKKTAFGA